MGYGIFRVSKIKTQGDLKRLIQHIQRIGSEIPNAKQPYDARPFHGSTDLLAGVEKSLPEKRRKDAVLALDFVLTVSPESVRLNGDKQAALDPKKVTALESAAKEFLQKEFGQCAHAMVHHDETTPHIQGVIVPNKGFVPGASLCAKTLFGPRQLAEYQTKWFETLNRHGLQVQRGEPGSQAAHQSIKDYYGQVDKPVPKPPSVPAKPPDATTAERAKEAMGMETEHSKAVQERDQAKQKRAVFLEQNYDQAMRRAAAAEAQAKAERERANRAEARLAKLKQQASDLRSLPLAEVLQSMGCTRHKDDRLKWATPAGTVTIEKGDGARFNSFDDPSIKGRGAIDLVMKITGQSFQSATAWLASQYGLDATAKDAAGLMAESVHANVKKAFESVSEPSPMPTPQPTRLERVTAYLTQVRGIPSALVSKLVDAGKIYADKFANCIFVSDSGQGCEIRGTGQKPFHGQHGKKDGFTVAGDPKKVAIVESAIEAISCTAMTGMTAVGVGGSNNETAVEIARSWISRGATVFAGQNSDKAGEKQASALIAAVPEVHRLKPRFEENDWNDALKKSNQSSSLGSSVRLGMSGSNPSKID